MTSLLKAGSRNDVREAAERVMSAWRAGAPPDAAAAIREHPALAASRSVVMDLAYEEYLQRERAGDAPDPAEFARGFPGFQASVQELLEAHCLLVARPELLRPPEEPWPAAGATLEGLELCAELGRGTFGRAYLAFDPAIGRMRVLKLAPGGSAEAKLIGSLNHPNVIDVLWTRSVGRRTAVCMPFVGAVTLATLLERTKSSTPSARAILDETRPSDDESSESRSAPIVFERDSDLVAACAIGAKIADAIHYLHGKRLTHGDVKPSNVVLQPGGSPQVIDFNLAAGEEPAHAISGTPAYMAPELLDATLAGNSAATINGRKADLFSLGVTLIELITGRHPYRSRSDGTLASLNAALRRGAPEWPPQLPASLARLLHACLAVEPARRPASVGELAAALDRFVKRERTRGTRRKRFALAVAGGLAVGGFSAGIVFALPNPPAIERPPETAPEFHGRGLAALHSGKADAARGDFLSAYERSEDPYDLALAAYCHALTGEQRTAIEWNRVAIAGGADTPEVRNNLGAALVKTSAFEEAQVQLDVALGREPNLQAARYNRAILRYQLALKPVTRDQLAGAVQDIGAALASGPTSGELHLDAARIYAFASATDPALADRAFEQLEGAARLGLKPATCLKDPMLKPLGKHPRFAKLSQVQPTVAPAPLQLKLVEPHK